MNTESIQVVAVLGLGTMGHGIAQTFAAAGCTVRCYDTDASACESLLQRIRDNFEPIRDMGILADEPVDQIVKRVTISPSEEDAVVPAQFVLEAVAEVLDVKQNLFARMEHLAAPETILASNTSSFLMTQISQNMHRPERTINTHWFNPPHIVPVVEVIPGHKTSQATTMVTMKLLQRIGKLPIHLKQELPGFLVNRVQVAMLREIWDLLDRGVATVEEIDRAISGSIGLRLAVHGPLAINDFGGLDITRKTFENLIPTLRSDQQLSERVKRLVGKDHLGVKSGKGFYEYPLQTSQEKLHRRDRCYLALSRLLGTLLT